MKIFSISLDKNILDKNSGVAKRMVEYGNLLDKYTIITLAYINSIVDLSDNVKVYSINKENKIFAFFNIYKKSCKILKKEKYDLITVQDIYFVGFLATILVKKFKIGLEVQVHGFEKFYGIRKILFEYIIKKANSVRVVSQRLKSQLIKEFNILEEKIIIVSIYTEPINVKIKSKEVGNDFVFLTVSRLVKVKNIEMQIKAFKNVIDFFENNKQKKVKDLKLWIIGDGECEKKLKFEVKKLGLENYVKFWGWQTDLEKFYNNSDVFLLTSNYEGWGVVVIEAVSYGLPIIMTDVGCAGEFIINNENGVVIPIGDQKLLEYKMIDLIENNNLRKKLSENAKKSVSKLLTKEQTLDLYKKSWEKAIL